MEIQVRHSEPHDVAAIKAIYEQPSCYAGTLQLPYPSLDQWQRFLGSKPDNFHSLVAVADDQVLGQLGLEVNVHARRKHTANLGMAVAEAHQNLGVGGQLLTEALMLSDKWLNVHRLELEVYTDNQAAISLYKKFGFKIEGTATDYAYRAGAFVDVHLMARLRPAA